MALIIGFNADPGSQTNADPDLDPVQTSSDKKLNIYMKIYLK